MTRLRTPAPEPRLAAAALLVGLALLVGRGQVRFRESPLVDVSAWQLQEPPNVAGRFSRMREAITGPPSEAKRRWSRMMKARRIAPAPTPAPPGAGPTGGFGPTAGFGPPSNFTFAVSPGAQVPRLLEGVVQEALARKSERVAGSGDLGPMLRQSGDGPPSLLRRRRQGLGEGGRAYPAGKTVRAHVFGDELTRWERAKEVLKALGRAYVVQDIGLFMRQFSTNAHLDLSILRQAVQEDFEQDADIQLDFELLEYRVTFHSIHVRIRWLRSSTLQSGAPAAVTEGTSDILMDRHDVFRIKSWRGLPPFGARDPQFIEQVRSGAPNLQLDGVATGHTDTETLPPTPPPTGPPPPPPVELIAAGITLDSSTAVCIDFDQIPTATVDAACSAGSDVSFVGSSSLGNDYTVAGTAVPSTGNCDESSLLEQHQGINLPMLASVTENDGVPQPRLFSNLTDGGRHVIFEIVYAPIPFSGSGPATVRYMRGPPGAPTGTIYPSGTAICP